MDTSVVDKGDRGGGRGIWLALAAVLATFLGEQRVADACGCLSPPAVTSGDYAVNQRAEQIIFEVEPGWVTAHVLIKYAGKPESFAWIIPVPEAPELSLSPTSAFGLLDKATAPDIAVSTENLCPSSPYTCAYHDAPSCGFGGQADDGAGGGFGLADAGTNGGNEPPPVTVIDQKVVGDYQTVTFRANEAAAATQWLRDNGFIVNSTTSIYMEPYVQANMVFVAAKLVAGAGIDGIKPLRMRYRAAFPMVPLLLTAVGADPHMTVTTFIYGDEAFRPMGHPIVTVDPARLARDRSGRLNYPMVLAKAIDDVGGDGFAIEYRGAAFAPSIGGGSCCGNGSDFCNLGHNNKCECPRDLFDKSDCDAEGDLPAGIALLDDLAQRYPHLTRITTRVSPEEMRFDPTYERDYGAQQTGRLSLRGEQASLASCESAVIDKTRFAEVAALEACSAMYCGIGGECVTTANGAACACGGQTVAQRFLDLDGSASVTCVPRVPTVDLRAGGHVLPDACAGVSCGLGQCIDRNGVAVCDCNDGTAARTSTGTVPKCEPIRASSATPGATDFSDALRDLAVCAPPPPTCGEGGWLVKTGTTNPGVSCGNTEPPPWKLHPGPSPTCGDWFGCGCQQSSAPLPTMGLAWIVAALISRRRRRIR